MIGGAGHSAACRHREGRVPDQCPRPPRPPTPLSSTSRRTRRAAQPQAGARGRERRGAAATAYGRRCTSQRCGRPLPSLFPRGNNTPSRTVRIAGNSLPRGRACGCGQGAPSAPRRIGASIWGALCFLGARPPIKFLPLRSAAARRSVQGRRSGDVLRGSCCDGEGVGHARWANGAEEPQKKACPQCLQVQTQIKGRAVASCRGSRASQARTCAAILPDRATAPPGRPLGALAGLVAGAAEGKQKRFDWV